MGGFQASEEIHLDGGLDIQGTLYFPPETKVTIYTKFITVQGLLSMQKDTPANGEPDVKIIMEGTEDVPFVPHEKNAEACLDTNTNTNYCHIGKKGIVAAGGQFDIDGFSGLNCKTWVNLLDNVRGEAPIPTNPNINIQPPNGCDQSFALDGWESSAGATHTIESGPYGDYTRVTNRKINWQGATVDIRNLASCIIPDQVYFLRAKVSLGAGNACSASGTNCPTIKIHSMNSTLVPNWVTLYDQKPAETGFGDAWIDLVGEVRFPASVLAQDLTFSSLYIGGPEPGIDISITGFTLELPNISYPPAEDQCLSLVTNGDAELSPYHAYPNVLMAGIGGKLSIGTEANGNQFFKISGRDAVWSSLKIPLNTECLLRHYSFTLSVDVWVQSTNLTATQISVKTENPNATTPFFVQSSDNCPLTSVTSGWKTCTKRMMFNETHETAIENFMFVRSEDKTSDLWLDNIQVTLETTAVSTIVVPADGLDCWDVGSEILVTSHTIDWKDYSKEIITSIETIDGNKHITLANPIEWHTTAKESVETAVEVALLSRNIRFTAADDDLANPKHGGHLMVLHTSNQVQKINGIEFVKFGQMGNMGRYPIHFHQSETNPGSVIAANTIRDSNQRCVVIHGTHNVTISYNIAYDTFGHCYMVEDGVETQNLFEYNLGLATKITPDEGILSIAESDMFASTFWISNPTNMFLNNVAAGSEDTGFWYEMIENIRGESIKFDPYYLINPLTQPYGYNIGTVCHSNHGDGFKLYPNGYFPEEEAVFKDFRSYLNHGDGVLLHNSANLAVDGGYFGDNRQGVEVDKQADDVRVSNAHIVGYSDLYRAIVQAGKKPSHCPAFRPLVGIQLHSYLRYRDSDGYIVENIKFEKFGETLTGCEASTAMNIDPQVRDTPPHYDAFATISNLTFEEGAPLHERFNGCLIWNSGVRNMAINDLDGSLNPVNPGTPGYVVSDDPMMTTFAPSPCHPMAGSCTAFCEGTCYRAINFATLASESYGDLKLEAEDDQGRIATFNSYYEYVLQGAANATYDNYMYQRRRFVTATLPYGNYVLRFKLNNEVMFPTFIETVWDDVPQCAPYNDNTTVTLEIPEPQEIDCFQLIRNNGLQDDNLHWWFHTGSSLKLATEGFASTRAIETGYRKGAWHGVGQFLDTRCITEGKQYEISARFRLQDAATGQYVACDPNIKTYLGTNVCPSVSLRFRKLLSDQKGGDIDGYYVYPVAEAVAPVTATGWNYIYGVVTITPTMAAADSIFMWVERGTPGINFIIDDLSVNPVQFGCDDASFNRDFEAGDTRWWGLNGQTATELISPGFNNSQYALKTIYRNQFWSSMKQNLNMACLEVGKFHHVRAMIKLEKDGAAYTCDPGKYWGVQAYLSIVCPTLAVRVDGVNGTTVLETGKVAGAWKTGEWNEVFGLFMVTPEMVAADNVMIWFTKLVADVTIIVDDVSVQPEPNVGCDSNMFLNGDLEYGDFRSWNPFFEGNLEIVQPGYNSDYAVAYRGSQYWHEGLGQHIEMYCLDDTTAYEISAQVKLFESDGTTPYACNATETRESTTPARCPVIAIAHQNAGIFPTYTPVGSVTGDWVVGEWNHLTGNFTMTQEQLSANYRVFGIVHSTQPGLVIVVDDFIFQKVV